MTSALSPLEEAKRRVDPFSTRDAVFARLAHGTVADITPTDDIVMRWNGLYRQLPLESEVYMLRLKLPGGEISSGQALVVAELAEHIGDGRLCITTRQNLELHGVRLADLPATFTTLDASGLLTSGASGDQVRNVIGCPVAGIGAEEVIDTLPLAEALTTAFLAKPRYANLPRKFKIALSGCTCGCVPYDINDVGLLAARNDEGQLGYVILVGDGLSMQPVHASCLGVWISENEVVEVLTHLLDIFQQYGNRENRGRARMKHLIAVHGIGWLRDKLQQRLGRTLQRYDHPIPSPARHDHLGVHPQQTTGLVYLGIPVPVGILSGRQLRLLAKLSQEFGQGRLRLTHLQNIILPDIAAANLAAILKQLLAQGLAVVEESQHGQTVVCVGKTYCTKAFAHTKETMLSLLNTITDPLLGSTVSLRVSGCPNGCAGHAMADIGLSGASLKTDNGVEERFDIFVGGGELPGAPAFARRILTRLCPDELAEIIINLLQRFRAEATVEETFSAYAQRVLWSI